MLENDRRGLAMSILPASKFGQKFTTKRGLRPSYYGNDPARRKGSGCLDFICGDSDANMALIRERMFVWFRSWRWTVNRRTVKWITINPETLNLEIRPKARTLPAAPRIDTKPIPKTAANRTINPPAQMAPERIAQYDIMMDVTEREM